MLLVDGLTLVEWVERLIWPFCRISAFIISSPIFGTQLVPLRVRTLFALAMTVVVLPGLPDMPAMDPLSPAAIVLIMEQILIGISLGFLLQLFIHIFALAGQMNSMQMGLGMASMNDPANGINVAVVGQMYMIFGTLLFLSINGHIVALDVVLESFYTLPVGGSINLTTDLYTVVGLLSWVFSSALIMALPVITSLLIVNIVFGVMTRAAPQLNIFSLGFPATMIFGLILLLITSTDFSYYYVDHMSFILGVMRNLVGIGP